MTTNDKTAGSSTFESVRDPKTRSMIEQIFYYENQHAEAIAEAGNDNRMAGLKKHAAPPKGSDCFQAWAMPDYMR
jgi:hypothetical protein